MVDTNTSQIGNNHLPPDSLREQQDQGDTISWKGRHVNLKPKCCQKNSTRKLIGTVLLSVGLVLVAATVLSALLFTSTLMVAGLATSSIATLAPGTTFLSLRKSTQDPQTRIQMGQSAVQAITRENLSYKQIRKRFGKQIDSLNILTNQDINILLRKDVDHNELSYSGCIERHGKEFLKIIDAKNRLVLRKKFLQMIKPEDTEVISLKKILADYSEDVKALHITAEEISQLLHDDTSDLNYEMFLDKHGIDFLNEDWIFTPEGSTPAKLLNQEARDNLKDSFIEHLHDTNISLIAAKDDHVKEIGLLNISEQELIDRLTARDLEKALKGKMRYLEFLKRNPGQGLRSGSQELLDEFREGLLKEIKQDTIGMHELLQKFPDDLTSLNINKRDIAEVTLHRDLTHLQNGALTYENYRKTHDFDSIKNYLDNPNHIKIVHDAFLKQAYSTMKKPVYAEDRNLLAVTDKEIFEAVERDLANPSLTYVLFTDRHGTTWTKDPNCTAAVKSNAADKLIKHFTDAPYTSFRSYLPHLRELDTPSEKIAQLMEKTCKQPFADLIRVHGYEWLDVEEFKNSANIRSALETTTVAYIRKHAKDALTDKPESPTNRCPLILRHKLLSQKASDILASHTNEYSTENTKFLTAVLQLQTENQKKRFELESEVARFTTETQRLETNVTIAKNGLIVAQNNFDCAVAQKNRTPQYIQVTSVQPHVHVGQPALRHPVAPSIHHQQPGTLQAINVPAHGHAHAPAVAVCPTPPIQVLQNNPAYHAIEQQVSYHSQILNQKTWGYNSAVNELNTFQTNFLPKLRQLKTDLERINSDETAQIAHLTIEFEKLTNSLAKKLSQSLANVNP